MSPTVLAYIAGIIDGEGCIGLYHAVTRGRRGDRYSYFLLRVEVASTSAALIEFMQSQFPGHRYAGKRPNRKPYYRWTIAAKKATHFLHAIYPYLVIKKDQADLVFRFRETLGTMGTPTSPEVKALRQRYFDELHAMKRVA